MGVAGDDPVMKSQFEDRITVVLLIKKQLPKMPRQARPKKKETEAMKEKKRKHLEVLSPPFFIYLFIYLFFFFNFFFQIYLFILFLSFFLSFYSFHFLTPSFLPFSFLSFFFSLS